MDENNLTLQDFILHEGTKDKATKDNDIWQDRLTVFKLFWTKENQTDPNKYPNVMELDDWYGALNTYFEGGYGI